MECVTLRDRIPTWSGRLASDTATGPGSTRTSRIRAHELAAASGSELRLAAGDSPAARILQLLGLDKIVPVYRDVQRSLATPGRT
jgi:hypothetical protein